MPALIGLLAIFMIAAGPPVQRNGNVSNLRLYPHQVAAMRQAARWPEVQAQAALVADLDANRTLFEKAAAVPRPMASITKIMTALLALENGPLDAQITAPAEALAVGGSSMFLGAGETMTLEDLLYGLLLPSGNDAAVAIAVHLAGSEAAFVELMNQRAAQLGLTQTHFANAHGMDAPGHYASARDLYTLTRAALEYPVFARIVATSQHQVAGRTLVNNNELLALNRHADGVKTGTTDLAGECLIASFDRNGHRLLIVILGSTQRYADALDLLAHYDASFGWLPLSALPSALDRARDRAGEWRYLTAGPAPTVFLPRWQWSWVQLLRQRSSDDNDLPGAPAGALHFLLDGQELGAQTLFWGAY